MAGHENSCHRYLVVGVIDWSSTLDANGKTKAVDWGVVTDGAKGVHDVRWDMNEITLTDFTFVVTYRHDSSTIKDVVKLVSWV